MLLAAAWLLLRGRTGRSFRAVRDSEVAAVSFGIHLPTYKTLAFSVSAFYAGVAGALFAVVNLSYVSPETFALRLSIYLVVGTVAAGLGTLWGIVFGALLIEWLVVPTFEVATVSRTDIVEWADKRAAADARSERHRHRRLRLRRGARRRDDPAPEGGRRPAPAGCHRAGRPSVHSLSPADLRRPVSDRIRRLLVAAGIGSRRLDGRSGGLTDRRSSSAAPSPISGEASSAAAVARGAEAYFKSVNAAGGVNRRKITYKFLDDGYDPSKTVQAVRELVQQDQVFALFNTLGTNNNLAVRDFLNQSGVPHVFVASGANTWGADYKKYPWTIGFIPSYVLERARSTAGTS